VDESAPCTEVQVRLVGLPPFRVRLNQSHTIADLKMFVELKLSEAGEMPRPYALSSGFPPKLLGDDSATLKDSGVLSATVIHRWC